MGVILSATDSLNWLGKITGQDPAKLSGAAEAGFRGPGEEIFLPYLSRRAHPAQQCRCARQLRRPFALHRLRRVMAQAVMEGVAFAFRDCQRVLNDAGTDDRPPARGRRRLEVRRSGSS